MQVALRIKEKGENKKKRNIEYRMGWIKVVQLTARMEKVDKSTLK